MSEKPGAIISHEVICRRLADAPFWLALCVTAIPATEVTRFPPSVPYDLVLGPGASTQVGLLSVRLTIWPAG